VVSAIDFYSAFDSFRFIYYLFDLFALQPRRRNLFWPAPVSAGQVNHSYATDTRMSSAHFVLFALLRLAAIQFNSAWFGYENTFHFDFVAIEMEMLHSVEEKPVGEGGKSPEQSPQGFALRIRNTCHQKVLVRKSLQWNSKCYSWPFFGFLKFWN